MKAPGKVFAHILALAGLALVLGTAECRAARPFRTAQPDAVLQPWRWISLDASKAAGPIRRIVQDREGNIWLATDRGAQRYDGYRWTTYTTEDGLVHNKVRAIVQTRDGAMWFGTYGGGISRFDGKAWTTYTTADGLAGNYIEWGGLCEARDGTLWAGMISPRAHEKTRGGICRFDGQKWTTLDLPENTFPLSVTFVLEASDGALWLSTPGQGALRFDGIHWTRYTTAEGLGANQVTHILEASDDALWFACRDGGVSRFDGRKWQTYTAQDGLPEGLFYVGTWQSEDGKIWGISTSWDKPGVLCRLEENRWKTYTSKAAPQLRHDTVGGFARDGSLWFFVWRGKDMLRFDPVSTKWRTFPCADSLLGGYADADGSVWFGTRGGAVRYDGARWVQFTSEDGLLDAPVYRMAQTEDGCVWFFGGQPGKFEGISRYDRGTWTRYPKEDVGLEDVRSVFGTKDGALWFAGSRNGAGAASRYDGQTWRVYTTEDGLLGDYLTRIYQAENGDVWFAAGAHRYLAGYGLLRFNGTHWMSYTTRDGLSHDCIYDILQAPDGTVWAGTANGLSAFDGCTWHGYTYEEEGQLGNRKVSQLTLYNGDIWFCYIGPSRAGVTRYDGKTWTTYTTQDGLVDDRVRRIYSGTDGALWFGTDAGISRFDGNSWTNYTVEDGLPGNRINRMWQSSNGAFWFLTYDGRAASFTPDGIAPQTAISAPEDVSSAGNATVRWSGRDRWDDTSPGDLHYQWRLDGGGWSVWSNRTDVTLTSLSTGRHRFEARARDRDLNVEPIPVMHALVVEAPWWKNPWAIGLAVALLGLVGMQTGRVVRRDRSLQASNAALSEANIALKNEMTDRARAEAERLKLDVQLQRFRYLYRLRSVLGTARSAGEAIREAGKVMMAVLSPTVSGGVLIHYDGDRWRFGETEGAGQIRYERPFAWGGKDRGRLILFCGVALSEAQERALLDETAGQIAQALASLEMEMQILQSARLVSLGEMAAGVAHELNQPLSAISATAGDIALRLIEGPELPKERLKSMMQDVLDMVERMAGTIDHMRIFSRDTSQEAAVRFSLNEAVRAALKLIEAQLKGHGIVLQLDLAGELPYVLGHPHQIEQVLLNLLVNARDALDEQANRMPGDPGEAWARRLIVRTRCETDAERRVVAEVEDNGIGIDEGDRVRVFEPFFTTKEADRGTGLGLSISYAIVKNHSGRISFDSRQGKGTTFRLNLPAVEEV